MRESPVTLTDAPAAVLVQGLDDLQRGVEFQLLLICRGQEAIEPLARFLLGPPSLHAQPRILAAEALGAIGGPAATDALIAALLAGDLAALPLTYRLPEEAVRNRIARELGRLGDPAAVEPLLDALIRFHLVEAGAALLSFGDARAVSPLIECLEDDFLRERAAAVLFEFGPSAADALAVALEQSREAETRRSIVRRATCARLLGEIGAAGVEPVLRARLADGEPLVRTAAAVALAHLLGPGSGDEVVGRLVEGIDVDHVRLRDDCAEALAEVGTAAIPRIVAAFTRGVEREEGRGERMPGAGVRTLARTLGQLGPAGARALAELLDHPRCFVRALAVANLGQLEPDRAGSLIGRALCDPDRRVRRTAAARLKQLGVRRHA
jgi:HEAT repeat protein